MPQCEHGPAIPPARPAAYCSTKFCSRPRPLKRFPTLPIRAAMPTSSPSSTPPVPPVSPRAFASPPPTSPTCFPAPPSASTSSWAKLASPTASSIGLRSISRPPGFFCSPASRARASSRCPPISPSLPTRFAAPLRSLYAKARAAWQRQNSSRARTADPLWLALGRKLIFSKIKERFGPHLRALICGSAPLAPETHQFFLMLGIPVLQAYGLTETTAICTLDDPRGQIEPGHVGQAIRGIEMKAAGNEEIVVRGPHIFSGYWNRPEETARVLRDGWFHTGDQG